MFLKILIYGFWLIFFYDIFIEDLNIIDSGPAPWFWAPVVTILAIFLTLGFWLASSDFKSVRYFNLKTGYFSLPDITDASIKKGQKVKKNRFSVIDKKEIKEIDHLQLLTYEKTITTRTKTQSVRSKIDVYEINVVMINGSRYNICAYQKKEKSKKVIKRLSSFLDKPFS